MNARKRTAPAAPSGGANATKAKNRTSLPFPMIGVSDPTMGMDDMLTDDIDDGELEAELNAILNGTAVQKKKAPQTLKPPAAKGSKSPSPSSGRTGPSAGKPILPDFGLDLAAIERIGMEDDDEEIGSADENDPELLAELEGLSTDDHHGDHHTTPSHSVSKPTAFGSAMVNLLVERLENYEAARQQAMDQKEANRVRRCDRAIKTLQDQIKRAKKGESIPDEEIPPSNFIRPPLETALKPIGESKPYPSEPAHLSEKANDISTTQTPASEAPAAVPDVPLVHPTKTSPPSKPPPPLPTESSPERPPPPPPRPSPPSSTDLVQKTNSEPSKEDPRVSMLVERQNEYKSAALSAKRDGNMDAAKRFMLVIKQIDPIISDVREGKDFDLSQVPPHPSQLNVETKPVQPQPSKSETSDTSAEIPNITVEEVKDVFGAPDAPKTVMEALEQRLQKYQSTAKEAKTAGEDSKARRLDRIVKQYQQAIADYKAKRPVNFDELPAPPGYGPIPTGPPPKPTAQPSVSPAGLTKSQSQQPPAAGGLPQGAVTKKPAVPGVPTSAAAPHASHHPSSRESRHEQQYHLLVERQKQLKLAALKAKKEGAMETARHYLRQALQLDQMIEASTNGIPVDVSTIPKAPPGFGVDNDFQVVSYEEAGAERPPKVHKNRHEIFLQLEKDLVAQAAMCASNAVRYKKAGDIPLSERFEKFGQNTRKDLESLRNAFKYDMPVPKFHYETRVFSIVKCNPELPDNAMELTIVRGFGYTLSGFGPTDFTTCVRFVFAYPTEAPQTGKTAYIAKTNEPEYNSVHKININRKSRSMPRIFKAKGLVCEVIVKMGFLKGEKVLGTCTLSLEALETRCTYHTAVDLMEGKKAVGGKLEVIVRIREPLLKQQVEELKEKWLVIDQFLR